MSYVNSLDDDLVRYLIGDTEAPDSVIDTPFNAGQIYVGALVEDEDLSPTADGVQASLKKMIGQANSRWLRDQWTLDVNAIGSDRSKYRDVEALITNIVHTLLGHSTIYIGDVAYLQFNATFLPRFIGYYEGSKPLFNSTLTVVAEGLVDKFNRSALC